MGQEDARGEGKGEGTIDLSTNLLLQSLARTLAAYPHFAGELEHVPFRAEVGAKAEERGGRLRVVFGGVEEGGVELLVAKCEVRGFCFRQRRGARGMRDGCCMLDLGSRRKRVFDRRGAMLTSVKVQRRSFKISFRAPRSGDDADLEFDLDYDCQVDNFSMWGIGCCGEAPACTCGCAGIFRICD